jgi:hypothetical protein
LESIGPDMPVAISPDDADVYRVSYDYAATSNSYPTDLSVNQLGVNGSPTSLSFGDQRVGTYGDSQTITLTNVSPHSASVSALELVGADSGDFFGQSTCTTGTSFELAPGASCVVTMYFSPFAIGLRAATFGVVLVGASSVDALTQLSGNGTEGYYIAGSKGEVGSFGDGDDLGDLSSNTLNKPIVGLAATPNGDGYWLVASDGGIFSFGDAAFYGSTGALHLNKPIVGMAATPDGDGYWLVASDGGIFSFGDAAFYGSLDSAGVSADDVVGIVSSAPAV